MTEVLVVTWAPGGNLPPLLAAASVLAARGHGVRVLASGSTRAAAEKAGFEVLRHPRGPDPDTRVAFEAQAELMLATAAGEEIALGVREVLTDAWPDVAIVDCMLPAGIAAARSTGTPVVSLVHFLYGLARSEMARSGGAWTTDLGRLNATHESLGLPPARDGLAAWEAPDLLLVTAPRWFDLELDYAPHVVHAGPLSVRLDSERDRSLVLLSFSTTVMEQQVSLVQRCCDALAGAGVQALLTVGPALDPAAVKAPGNVEVVGFADHDRVLARCAAVVTHGGLGTTLRALAHGVPLLLLPLGRDQGFNAARVAELGAGIRLPLDAAPDEIRGALATLLGDAGFSRAAAEAAGRIRAGRPDERAAEAVESVAG
jgi:UDP:flavonoid glycosyltransferase YjiC (YdhE family)